MAPQEKNSKYGHLPLSTSGPLECALTGTTLLNHPFFNKGSAHPKEERQAFNLTGLLPQSVQTLEQQANRAYEQYSTRPNDLAKNTFMTSLKEQNEVLFYKVRPVPVTESLVVGPCLTCDSFCTTIWRKCSASSTPQRRVMLSKITPVYSGVLRAAS